ncbi:hypothetical protein UlMin_018831 [Ulmus minor]
MEAQAQPMDSDPPAVSDELKLHELIAEGLDFDEWTLLISRMEKTFPDNMEKICLVYDSFLSEFPLCHGYWRRYADHHRRLCGPDKVIEIFERAVQSVTYSVSLWVDYCNFSISAFEDLSDIQRLFKRGISFVGKDYSCHTLWDKYIEFELSQQQWSSLAHIYVEALRFPTKKLHHYYDSFKKLAALCNKEMGCHSNSPADLQSESLLVDQVTRCLSKDEISCLVKDLFDPSISLERSKELLQKYLILGEQLYRAACQLDKKISAFETNIQRSYFHVKSLDVDHLENWHHYLDFVELQGDFDWVVKTYERCLIPCANYPEFWMRYVEFVETKGGREIANWALKRATQIFVKRVPVIHLFNARFKEHTGDAVGACAAFSHCDTESDSNFIENVILKANMEKRLGNFVVASSIYEEALEMAAAKKKLHYLPSLYVHFSRLKYMITDSADAARDVLIDGIKHLPNCKLLLEELINFVMIQGGERHINVVDSIIVDAISPGSDISHGLSAKDAEDVSNLYLKLVDLCGTIQEIRKAWSRHIHLFPNSLRTAFDEQPITHVNSLKLAKEKEEIIFPMDHQQPSKNIVLLDKNDSRSSQDPTNQISEKKVPQPENQDSQLEQATVDQRQSKEADNGASEGKNLQSLEVSEVTRKKGPKTNASSIDLVSSKASKQPREDEPNKSFLNLAHQVAEGTESIRDVKEYSDGNDLKQGLDHKPEHEMKDFDLKPEHELKDFDHKPEHEMKFFDHKPEHEMKSLSLESLSLHPQDNSSPDLNPSRAFECGAPQETCNSSRSMTERNQQTTDEESSIKERTDSPQTEIQRVKPSSSRSHQSLMPIESPSQLHMSADSGGNWHRTKNYGRNRREPEFGFRGNPQGKSQQRRVSPQIYPQAESGGSMPMYQNYSQIGSLQNQQIHQGSLAQTQYQAATSPANIAAPTWPVQNVQQSNFTSSSQPFQSIGQQVPNNQDYNQMWQYYYYQQQQYQQQPPQHYQQQQPPQQYQQQQLQLQQHYLQLQPQQYLVQQQQFQQLQHQLYMQQAPQQPNEQQLEQNQLQQQNSQLQNYDQQQACLEYNVNNHPGAEPRLHINATQEQESVRPANTSAASSESLNSQEQSPGRQ